MDLRLGDGSHCGAQPAGLSTSPSRYEELCYRVSFFYLEDVSNSFRILYTIV